MNRRHVSDAHDQVQQALYDYTLNCYSHVPVSSWNSAFCFVFHGAHWLFFACLFFRLCFAFEFGGPNRKSLPRWWQYCPTFTPCPRAVKSISISSISTAVHRRRLYSWKCFTPSGNNLTPKIHNHSQQKEKKILKKIKLTKYHEEDDSGTRGNRFDKLRPLNFRCKYSGNLIVFQASLIDFLPFSKFAQTKVIVLIIFHSFFFLFFQLISKLSYFFFFFFCFFFCCECAWFFFLRHWSDSERYNGRAVWNRRVSMQISRLYGDSVRKKKTIRKNIFL